MRNKAKALVVVPVLVAFLLAIICALGYLILVGFGFPNRLGLPLIIRMVGLLCLGIGFTFMFWLFQHRSPVEIVVSTYVTITKRVRGTGLQDRPSRSEPLVVTGPQRFVRHPLYSTAVLLLIGWWLFLDYTFLLFAAMLLFLWFNYIVAPFEERELTALFGSDYESYASRTPRFFPSFRRAKNANSDR